MRSVAHHVVSMTVKASSLSLIGERSFPAAFCPSLPAVSASRISISSIANHPCFRICGTRRSSKANAAPASSK